MFLQLCLRLHDENTRMVLHAKTHRLCGDRRARSPAPARMASGTVAGLRPGHGHGLRPGRGRDGPSNRDCPADSGLTVAMGDEWPLRSCLELGALPGAVPCARLHARQVLWEWGLPALSENAELLVSELMTNAIRASLPAERVMPVRLLLYSDRSRLLIQVQDTNHHPPTPTGADDDDESGRGLHIVDAISVKCGWCTKEDLSGKIVWALIESNEP
jgi:anti-sigma regulatory factor (Ser/Thr protein kinase)